MIDWNGKLVQPVTPAEFYGRKHNLYRQAEMKLLGAVKLLEDLVRLEGLAPGCDGQEVQQLEATAATLLELRGWAQNMAEAVAASYEASLPSAYPEKK